MTSLSPIASSLSMARQMSVARSAPAPAAPVAATPAVATDKGAGSTGSLIRTASEQLDQFDRVMEKLRSNMAAGAVTYGGAPAMGQGRIVDRLA
ncbi:hypothetical protein [uncultured Sphingomonas sp.]|uniref:hypothetical protein n=1 Tax=uncultured Sphingomonas sp. TaxID=158754 RepID=UPI0025F51FD2|nr:hypothetical protein [uncultured Sphingomonas sp.]